jgi:hypothetical protein
MHSQININFCMFSRLRRVFFRIAVCGENINDRRNNNERGLKCQRLIIVHLLYMTVVKIIPTMTHQ